MKEQIFTLCTMTLDLQLFAAHTNVTTDVREAGQYYPQYNDLSAEMKTFYDMTLLEEAGPYLAHGQFGVKKPIPRNGGKTIEFRKYTDLPKATTPLTEGVTPDGKRLDVTTITATIEQYGDYVEVSDLLDLTALDDNINEAAKLCGKQAGLTLDTIVRDILNSGTNVYFCPTVSGSTETPVTERDGLDGTSVLSVKQIKKIVTLMKAQNVPKFKNKYYVAIVHPYVTGDIMNDKEWIEASQYAGSEQIFAGEIGMIAGVRFVESTEAKIFCGEDLASNSRTLTVNGAVSASTTIAFDGGTVAADALIGREILVGTTKVKITDNTASSLTVDTAVTCSDNTVIYPGEGGAGGLAVFSTLFMGEEAYGITEISGGGLQTIVKQLGSSGTADPLNQRATVGWKATHTAEILHPFYLKRVESCSPDYSAIAKAN